MTNSVVCESCERCRTTNPERLCDYCKTLPRPPSMPDRLRALADHLEKRAFAPSLDGYDLADGLRAAAELLEGRPGPMVHGDVPPDVAPTTPRHALPTTPLSTLPGSPQRLSASQREGIDRRVRMGQSEEDARAAVIGAPQRHGESGSK